MKINIIVTQSTLVGFFAIVVLISRKKRLNSHNSREIIEVFLLYWLIIRNFLLNLPHHIRFLLIFFSQH